MARKTTPKAAAASKAANPAPAAPETPVMKKPELLDLVVARTNLKKRDVKPAVEAAMAVIAETLRGGTDVNLPPLGKLRVVKTKELDGGAAVMTVKLRTQKHASVAAGVAAPDDTA